MINDNNAFLNSFAFFYHFWLFLPLIMHVTLYLDEEKASQFNSI